MQIFENFPSLAPSTNAFIHSFIESLRGEEEEEVKIWEEMQSKIERKIKEWHTTCKSNTQSFHLEMCQMCHASW